MKAPLKVIVPLSLLLFAFSASPAAGADGLLCNDLEVTVNLALGESPTNGDDVIRGTNGPDTIDGLGGRDTICGLQGDDTIVGGDGFDKIFAGSGKDTIDGGAGNDLLVGGTGNDSIDGGNGNDRIQGGAGADVLDGGNGSDRISGGDGNDILRGGKFDDLLFGNLGRDQLFGDAGNDTLRGGAWKDVMNGGDGANDGCTLTDPSGLAETRVDCERGVFASTPPMTSGPGPDAVLAIEANIDGTPGNEQIWLDPDGSLHAGNLVGTADYWEQIPFWFDAQAELRATAFDTNTMAIVLSLPFPGGIEDPSNVVQIFLVDDQKLTRVFNKSVGVGGVIPVDFAGDGSVSYVEDFWTACLRVGTTEVVTRQRLIYTQGADGQLVQTSARDTGLQHDCSFLPG